MNREAYPLLFAIFFPIGLVLIILLYFVGIDVTLFFRNIDIIYYIIVFPIVLGLLVTIMKYRKE